jgi:hypothetical protein
MGAKDPSEGESRIECHTDLSAFFYETLRGALASRRVEAPVPTERYLVDLLADLGHDETVLAQSLVVLELESPGPRPRGAARAAALARRTGALSISGLSTRTSSTTAVARLRERGGQPRLPLRRASWPARAHAVHRGRARRCSSISVSASSPTPTCSTTCASDLRSVRATTC